MPADIDLQQLAEQAAKIEGWVHYPEGCPGQFRMDIDHWHAPNGDPLLPCPTLEERWGDRYRMLVKYALASMSLNEVNDLCRVSANTGPRRREVFSYLDHAVAVTLAFVAVFGGGE